MEQLTVLLVDESVASALAARHLRMLGIRVDVVHSLASALASLRRSPPDLVILALDQVRSEGSESYHRLREADNVPMIVLATPGDAPTAVEALELGAADYLVQPLNPGELVARVKAVLRRSPRAMPDEPPLRTGTDQ